MKYLKTFERYRYLDNNDTLIVKYLIYEYFEENSDFVINNFKDLTLKNFENNDFNYKEIFKDLLAITYNKGNFYYEIDSKIKNKKLNYPLIELRNTIGNILNDIYKEIKSELNLDFDKKLIQLLEQNPEEYSEYLIMYDDVINKTVKKACEWMLEYEKYNL